MDKAKTDKQIIRRIGMSVKMWKLIDEYWHRQGHLSRTAAVRALVKKGLSQR